MASVWESTFGWYLHAWINFDQNIDFKLKCTACILGPLHCFTWQTFRSNIFISTHARLKVLTDVCERENRPPIILQFHCQEWTMRTVLRATYFASPSSTCRPWPWGCRGAPPAPGPSPSSRTCCDRIRSAVSCSGSCPCASWAAYRWAGACSRAFWTFCRSDSFWAGKVGTSRFG